MSQDRLKSGSAIWSEIYFRAEPLNNRNELIPLIHIEAPSNNLFLSIVLLCAVRDSKQAQPESRSMHESAREIS
jgi:hypothetical protein